MYSLIQSLRAFRRTNPEGLCIGALVGLFLLGCLTCHVECNLDSSFQRVRNVGPKALKIGHWSFKYKSNRQQRLLSKSVSMSKQSTNLANWILCAVSLGIKVPESEVEEQVGCKSGPR